MGEQTAETLLELSEDQLLARIGESAKAQDTASHLRPLDSIAAGRRWLRAQQGQIADRVCTSPRVRSLVQDHAQDLVLIAAIADLISTCCSGIPPSTVAVLLYKRGLTTLCSTYWNNSSTT